MLSRQASQAEVTTTAITTDRQVPGIGAGLHRSGALIKTKVTQRAKITVKDIQD